MLYVGDIICFSVAIYSVMLVVEESDISKWTFTFWQSIYTIYIS
jgi:hypothetical protein